MELGENIQSYLRWRGDVPFSHAAVNHVDALVLCKLAYFDLSRIAEVAEDQGITLAKCLSLVSDIHPKGPGDAGEGFFDEAASTARFGSVIARCYVDATPYDDDTQFSATEYVLPDGPVFVAFRGTDDTVLGWREDFELGYRRIPAQEKAERYLRDALGRAAAEGRSVIVGGHSKGANLAQYVTSSLTDSELAAGGVLLIMLNRIAIPLALTLAMFCGVIALLVEMLARLRTSGWNTRREGPRIFAFGVALVVFVLTLVKPDALYVYASLAFGISLGAAAWSYAQKAAARTRGGTSVAFNAMMAVLLSLSAAFVLVAPQEMLAAYAVTLGITLLVCSVGSFLDWRHDVMERLGE